MVVTPLMWKSLEKTAPFDIQLWLCPIVWDASQQKLLYHPFSRKLLLWACSQILGILAILVCALSIGLHFLGIAKVPFMNLSTTIVNMLFFMIGIFGEFVCLFSCKEILVGFDWLVALDKKLRKGWILLILFKIII